MTVWLPELEISEGPVYRAIARALEVDVRAGRLAAGDRLPTHRDLALRLGINVGTVSRAYAECERGGWIRGVVGRGTFVRGPEAAGVEGRFARSAGPAGSRPEVLDLSLNTPVDSPAPDLAAGLRALAARIDDDCDGREAPGAATLLGYQLPEGRDADREAGSRALALHGVEASLRRVALAAGAQHGISACLSAACRPGDAVAAEMLTYPGFQAAAEARGLRVEPVAMDAGGLLPESFEEVCGRARPRALYLSPSLQNPTASTLSLTRREQVLDVAERHDVLILEDDVHRMLARDSPTPLASMAPDRVVYIAGLAKCLAPGLRVAYLAIPEAWVERVVEQLWCSIWMVSPITAALASAWVRDGTLERVAAGRGAEARARQDLAREVLGTLPPGFRAVATPTAYHVWLELGESWNAIAFANAARERDVIVTPADAFYLGRGSAPPAVRISLSAARDRASLVRALRILAEVAAGAPSARVRL